MLDTFFLRTDLVENFRKHLFIQNKGVKPKKNLKNIFLSKKKLGGQKLDGHFLYYLKYLKKKTNSYLLTIDTQEVFLTFFIFIHPPKSVSILCPTIFKRGVKINVF